MVSGGREMAMEISTGLWRMVLANWRIFLGMVAENITV